MELVPPPILFSRQRLYRNHGVLRQSPNLRQFYKVWGTRAMNIHFVQADFATRQATCLDGLFAHAFIGQLRWARLTVRAFANAIEVLPGVAGFDNQGFGSTQAMDPFIRQFGDRRPNGTYFIPAYFLSFLNSLVFIGFAIGAVLGSMISNRYGRRMTIFTMSLWAIVTAILCATSKSKAQVLVSRIVSTSQGQLLPRKTSKSGADVCESFAAQLYLCRHGAQRNPYFPSRDHACACSRLRSGQL